MNLTELLEYSTEKAKEHIEYVNNKEFNFRIDNGDIEGYELFLRKPNGEEQSVSPISAALFVSDLPTYRQIKNEDNARLRREVLNIDRYPSNEDSYDSLLSIVRHGSSIIPFIGAGFSVSAGCPSWSNYIISQAVRANMDESEVKDRLQAGEHEKVMNEVIASLSMNLFQRDFRSKFEGSKITPALSPSTELLRLFDGCAITTNFDRVLEESHKEIMPYTEKVVGKDDTGRFLQAVFRGEKYLLKLHGNIDEQRDRILTQDEYNSGYGENTIDKNLPIPRTLSKIFSSNTVLFLGCSLIADRYLEVLKNTYETEAEMIPNHFTLLPAPEDEEELKERDKFLAEHGITPIWFAEGEWDRPAEILKLLKAEL